MLWLRLRFQGDPVGPERDGLIPEDHGAFVPGGRLDMPPLAEGPLAGLTFAVKALIDVEGTVTGGGNPDWAAAQTPAATSAPVVEILLHAGARCVGKTVTDELAFSLEGRNAHYGTPYNAAAPGNLPGGSSSGSAAAVAAGLCDFALGTDTGGSVRVPGAFCGLYAFRPSHDALSLNGVIPFAPSYDTVGWFARDPETLRRVGDVLLPESDDIGIETVSVGADTFPLCDPDHGAALLDVARGIATGPDLTLFAKPWEDYHAAYASLQARDIRAALGSALDRIKPRFAPDMAERFAGALNDTAPLALHEALRRRTVAHTRAVLPPGHAAILPTAPVKGLPKEPDGATLGAFYPRALALSAIAGHAGLPQLQIPTPAGGLSLIAAQGADRALLAIAECIPRTT